MENPALDRKYAGRNQKTAIDEFGGLEQWKEHYIKTISSEDMQKRYQKMVEWFGAVLYAGHRNIL